MLTAAAIAGYSHYTCAPQSSPVKPSTVVTNDDEQQVSVPGFPPRQLEATKALSSAIPGIPFVRDTSVTAGANSRTTL